MTLTKAEAAGLRKCPACTRRSLRTEGTRATGTVDRCISCGYFMAWKAKPPITQDDLRSMRELQRRNLSGLAH